MNHFFFNSLFTVSNVATNYAIPLVKNVFQNLVSQFGKSLVRFWDTHKIKDSELWGFRL